MRRKLFALTAASSLLALVAGNAFAHGGGGGGGGGGHGGGGGFGGGGHGGGFGGGGHGGGGFGGGHYGGGGYYGGGHMGGGGYYGGGHIGSSPGLSSGGMHSGGLGTSGLGTGGHHAGTGLNHSGQNQASFVHNHVHNGMAGNHTGQHTVNHSGNFNHLNHQNYGHNYWRQRSYFFGFYSPFGLYLGYPWWWNGYGNRFGYGYGYGYGGYGYGYGGYGGYGYYYQPNCAYYGYGAPGASTVAVQDQTIPPTDQLENSLDYAGQGEVSFKAGKYADAIQNWRHALVDDPRNGAIVLLLSQALFAAGQYDEAAGATQAALQLLPQDKWGTVVVHYKELYPNIQDYTNQLRALEKERNAKPDSPAIRFLLGYHFGYLGYPKQAVRELDKALELAPKDEIAKKLRDEFSAKLEGADKPKPGEPEKEPEKSAQGKTGGADA